MSEEKKKQLALLREALDGEAIPDDLAKEVVRDLGVDVKAFAAKLRSSVSEWDAADRKKRFAEAERKRLQRQALLAQLPPEPVRPRGEQMSLLAKYKPPHTTGAQLNFMKFQEMTDEELARLVALARFDAEHPELAVSDDDTEDDDR